MRLILQILTWAQRSPRCSVSIARPTQEGTKLIREDLLDHFNDAKWVLKHYKAPCKFLHLIVNQPLYGYLQNEYAMGCANASKMCIKKRLEAMGTSSIMVNMLSISSSRQKYWSLPLFTVFYSCHKCNISPQHLCLCFSMDIKICKHWSDNEANPCCFSHLPYSPSSSSLCNHGHR